jgi:hypothetical protein
MEMNAATPFAIAVPCMRFLCRTLQIRPACMRERILTAGPTMQFRMMWSLWHFSNLRLATRL